MALANTTAAAALPTSGFVARRDARSSALVISVPLTAVRAAALALLVVALTFCASAVTSMARAQSTEGTAFSSRVVQPGDTLWSIAEEHSVDGLSLQENVSFIQKANGLDDARLQPGQRILVPAN